MAGDPVMRLPAIGAVSGSNQLSTWMEMMQAEVQRNMMLQLPPQYLVDTRSGRVTAPPPRELYRDTVSISRAEYDNMRKRIAAYEKEVEYRQKLYEAKCQDSEAWHKTAIEYAARAEKAEARAAALEAQIAALTPKPEPLPVAVRPHAWFERSVNPFR